mmetsp:Transcript_16819/g.30056  ORF Transcript_16819/g.30056 Transcript_16819/m.30056 type:complete len:654 (+) Transcript_16819:1-1962(+)
MVSKAFSGRFPIKAGPEEIISILSAKFGGKKAAQPSNKGVKTDVIVSSLAAKLSKMQLHKAEMGQFSKLLKETEPQRPVMYLCPRFFEGPIASRVSTSKNDIPPSIQRASLESPAYPAHPEFIVVECPDEDTENLLAYQTGDFYQLVKQEISKLQTVIEEICLKLPENKKRGKKFLLPFLTRIMTKSMEPDQSAFNTEESIESEAEVNQERVLRMLPPPLTLDVERLEAFTYKKKGSSSSLQVPADDFTNAHGEISKYGYLWKRRALTVKFHKRWVVVRGFKLFWYRKQNSSVAKGMIYLPPTPVQELKVSKEKCFSIDRPSGVKLVFLLDSHSYPWKVLLQNQTSYRRYLDQATVPRNCVVSFFRDVNSKELCIRDEAMSGTETSCMAEGMLVHNRLQVLILERCLLADVDFSQLIEACVGCTRIETLRVAGNMLTARSVQSITALIKQEEAQWNCLAHIDLSQNPIKDPGVELLTKALAVRFQTLYWPKSIAVVPFLTLELADCSLTHSSLHLICELLNQSHEISQAEESIEPCIKLNLRGNDISSMFIPYLGQVLKTFQCIYSLNLADCQLASEDCLVLALAIRSNSSVIELDLRGCLIEYEAAVDLIETLKMNFSLSKLYLSLNPELYSALIEKAGEIQAGFTMKTVDQ